MRAALRECAKDLLPPLILRLCRRLRRSYGFFGDYASWAEASAHSAGYDAANILQSALRSTLAVKEGRAAAERDTALLDRVAYSWPVLAGLLRASLANDRRLTVLDFGGALGTSYFRNRAFLKHASQLAWLVVEQPHFVACGKAHLEDDTLRFLPDIESCLDDFQPNVLFLSSVLQYLPEPLAFLDHIQGHAFPYILIDRTCLAPPGSRPRLTVQKVHPDVYDGSYPAWLRTAAEVRSVLAAQYVLLAEWDCDESAPGVVYNGFLYEKRRA